MPIHRHHILHTRATWESQEPTKSLRRTPELVVPIDDEYHSEIHRLQVSVPVLDHIIARLVQRDFSPVRYDYIASTINLMRAIQEVTEHPKSDHIQRMLGQLTVYAIEQQLPLIKEGLNETKIMQDM